ncbi:MAG TPA: diguanylate cyclase [Patescibacteria group bacterium]|nr:diguanylate cyclase [Patescibacteria group bacterium]
MQLAGYTVNDVIYALGETVVATATAANGERVVLKYLDSSRPSPEFSARWRHEYAVLRSIDSPFVIKARALEQVGRGSVLVLEAFAATNLAQLIARQVLDLSDKLTLAIRLTKALSAVHHHRLIHGDIAPKNVLVDAATLGLKLCDFGLSTRLSNEQRHAQDVFLRGTLDYMSPEQTGRTNLDIDYRSDFYSLGVTLYELFAGRKPFQSSDPMTLLHAQIATVPMPLHELDAAIPQPVSALVQKLLAKHPDDRYQSSFGLLQDLEACAERWRLYRRIELTELGSADVPERFCVAQKLYGRDAESAAILAAFERVSVGAVELLLISGYSGIGKTALVSELHRPVVARRGYFVRGKCDQYSRNQPFAALIQAFQLLMRQLAVEGSERRQYWKTRLNEALQDNAAAVVDIIPELALLIGSPPSLPALPAAESEQRFHIAFAAFVKTLAAHGHPLLVFLDDLQWADAQTLRLLEHLVRQDGDCSALIVGAYRDNEVAAGDPLSLTIAAIRNAQGRLEHLQLTPLGAQDVQQLVADTLHCAAAEAAPLAALCLEKTQGNPFFLGQFLRNLSDKGDIRYVRKDGAWRWDLALIRQRSMTDNVVDLMLQKLAALEPATRALLALAAHLGESFDHGQLMSVGDADAVATAAVLWPALQENLVVPLNEGYKFEHSPELLRSARYRFLHDRVQQAAHELTPAPERAALRLHCGRRLLAASDDAELEERLFIILESLNAASELMTDPAERARLLVLNLRGGIRAKSAAAYTAAVELLRRGEGLLLPDAWQQQPELALTVYKNLAEAEYLAGHFDVAEQRLVNLIEAAPSVAAKVSLCLTLVELMHLRGRFSDGFVVLRQALALLGRDFPESEEAAMQCYLLEFAETEAALATRGESALLAQSEMRDPERLLEMQVYYGLAYATYQINRGVSYVLGACRMVKTTLAHGQCDLSCIAYVTYQTAMAASGRSYPAVHAMGRAARRLAEQRENPYFRLSVYQYFGGFYQHWCEPLRETLTYLEQGMVMGRAGINPLAAGYCALLRSVNRFSLGLPLDELVAECEQGLAFLKRSHQPSTEAMLRHGVLQPALALLGKTKGTNSFDTAECDVSAYLADAGGAPAIVLAFFSAAMVRHAYLFGDRAQWQSSSSRLAMVGLCLPDSPSMVEASFFTALGLLLPEFSEADAQESNRQLAEAQLHRFQTWADHCPANFRHKALLIAAELARVRAEDRTAMELYAQAIDAATESGVVHCEALCNERYALFWLSQHQQQLASNFIREAYFHYRRWGASAKCRQIETQWPQVPFRSIELRYSSSDLGSSFRHGSEQTGFLDLQSLLKASQLLSQEIHLESLLEKMLGVLLENAGAEMGAIVVADDEDDELVVEVMGRLSGGRLIECRRIGRRLADTRKDHNPLLPSGLIEYVQLARSALVVNDPASDERFGQSRYLDDHRPKSVLCLPVVTQGKLVAVIYLENNLMENAFTGKHLKTLELLSAQAAISLVNAQLYESLERKVQARTEELRQMTMKDGLTGIANRRSFDERLGVEWQRSLRNGQPLTLLMLDIDHFKAFNDHYGHHEGDGCIRAVAQALKHTANRSSDLVARYGGEEFAILLPETDAASAEQVAATCLSAIAALGLPHVVSPVGAHVSVSIGICTLVVASESTTESLITRADQALYQAKRSGRNRYCQA